MPLATSAVFHDFWNGGALSSPSIGVAPSKKRTPATPMLSDAAADSVTVPDRRPPVGEVSVTDGGVVSAVAVTVTTPSAVCPDASRSSEVKLSTRVNPGPGTNVKGPPPVIVPPPALDGATATSVIGAAPPSLASSEAPLIWIDVPGIATVSGSAMGAGPGPGNVCVSPPPVAPQPGVGRSAPGHGGSWRRLPDCPNRPW